jgi:hypothetical protein
MTRIRDKAAKAALAAMALAITAAPAAATPVFTQVAADVLSPTVVDFESLPLGAFAPDVADPIAANLQPFGTGTALPGGLADVFSSLPLGISDITGATDSGGGSFAGLSGNVVFNSAGSGAPQVIQFRFASPVTAAGLLLFNNFNAPRTYGLRALDSSGAEIADEAAIEIGNSAEFIGFKSNIAEIAALLVDLPVTFNSGARPVLDDLRISGADGNTNTIPTPAAMPLLLSGLVLLCAVARRRRGDQDST